MIHNSVARDPMSPDGSHWGAGRGEPVLGVGVAAVLAQVSGPGGTQSRLALDLPQAETLVLALRGAADAADARGEFLEGWDVAEARGSLAEGSRWAVRATGDGEVAVGFRNRHGDEGEAVMETFHARDFADGLEEQVALVSAAPRDGAAPAPC